MLYHLTFEQWLRYGESEGYCSEQFCLTHDGGPTTETEQKIWDDGQDPCAHYVRLGNEKDWEENARYFLGL